MPEASPPYIELLLNRSRYQLGLLSGAHILAGMAPWFSRLEGWAAILSLLVFFHWVSALREFGWLGGQRVICGVRRSDHRWTIELPLSGWQSAELACQPLVTPFLTILRFRAGRRSYNVVMFADAVEPEVFRQIRVHLLLNV